MNIWYILKMRVSHLARFPYKLKFVALGEVTWCVVAKRLPRDVHVDITDRVSLCVDEVEKRSKFGGSGVFL